MTENNEKQAERFERIKRLALDAGAPSALPVPQSLRKIVRECIDGAALAQQPQGEAVASQSAEPVALTDARIEGIWMTLDRSGSSMFEQRGWEKEMRRRFARALLAASPADQGEPERREVCEVRDEHDEGGTWQNGYDTGWNECLDANKKGA